ncbi:molybdopterin converting factor subunit 1 [Aureibaculum sp. 2210JD6-5]|uniref:molybdopterin converting factor subunit 1 n=1 Tax=Aureibaculum sp. 2210JD6-5 TaxID=3103957 RepID=UPI002AAD0957|nr:molybdopterin converting factor subunit 1 [Aureibaculum sp. 2210JD6-5]MDY7396220.1 molybdopterin converting factor subunit 1 [Aureibaculum sp. 2210JD6-5]
MQIELLLFGIVKDIIGKSAMELQLPKNSKISNFKALLIEKYPKLNDYKSFSVAVNETYVDNDYLIKENDVVAIIPPVSGG